MVGRDPTHLDSHQHIHRHEPLASSMAELARRLDVPLRERGEIGYCGEFYGQTAQGEPYHEAIEVDALIGIIARLPPGATELGCHPGLDERLDSSYRLERIREVRSLCDPRVRAAIEQAGVTLRSF
jgi:predicted glycoside hydrolase/deacetylase ChbG (UPF0249 family)